MTSKFSRAALIASLAVGASGLVAVSADAATIPWACTNSSGAPVTCAATNNSLSTANYYVNNPAVTGAANLTPESAVVSGAVDTGGNPETLLPVPTGGLVWGFGAATIGGGAKWADDTSGKYVPVDGLPISGSDSNVSVTIDDAGISPSNQEVNAVSNGGADNYSDVTFEYDPVSDYDAVDNLPGPNTEFAQDVQVPTIAGLSKVTTTIGAFGMNAQNNTGNDPLKPGTKYYYWIVDQAGGTDAASNINIQSWIGASAVTDKCYPNAAIEADAALAALATTSAAQGPCIYYYGDTGGQIYYQSPNGVFTTPALGKLTIASAAVTKGKNTTLAVTDSSNFKASGSFVLMSGKTKLGSGKFAMQAHGKSNVKLTLTAKGKAAAGKKSAAALTLTSNFDQPGSRKSIKL